MANGGWYGSEQEWEQAESPLRSLDDMIERFAREHGLALTKNQKDWPSRHLTREGPVSCLLQVWRADLTADSWDVWAVCSQDRGRERYWKQEMLAERIPMAQLRDDLEQLLSKGLGRLDRWSAHPASLEFATKLETLNATAQGGGGGFSRLRARILGWIRR
jgi:hypothetical protein